MKRILVITLLISYSIASFGVNLNYYYCCGKLKTVSVAVNTEEKTYKTKTSKGCCENKKVSLKLKIDQKNSDQTTYHFTAQVSPVILHSNNYTVIGIPNNVHLKAFYTRPPPENLPSRQVLFCVFRI